MKMPPLAVILILLSGCAYHPGHHFNWSQRMSMEADNASQILKSETTSLNRETNQDFRKMNE
ncbi:hypothetical protein A6M23_00520 [Acidithiobacillus thiooxidans]|uniref:Lipoprotein n=1 Tax=Acidithiobacillus thiooxidans TaxID=930 RepID=A0A1C2IK45_ACITH|nr:hypothetical protein A6M23_00520 [Acidithiobacillus thiooxidans]OCX79151.1 hypothetical protein A6P08_18355 [Acidithiobacillus thiooxidans]